LTDNRLLRGGKRYYHELEIDIEMMFSPRNFPVDVVMILCGDVTGSVPGRLSITRDMTNTNPEMSRSWHHTVRSRRKEAGKERG
jgi:hypothetical protein